MSPVLPHGPRRTASAGLLLTFTTLSAAAVTDLEKRAYGLIIPMGVAPAEQLRANASTSHLTTMHGGLEPMRIGTSAT